LIDLGVVGGTQKDLLYQYGTQSGAFLLEGPVDEWPGQQRCDSSVSHHHHHPNQATCVD
jgi:hypothetical protein